MPVYLPTFRQYCMYGYAFACLYFLSVGLSVCLSMSVYLFIYLSVYPSIHPSIHPPTNLLPTYPSFCPSVSPSVCLSVRTFVCSSLRRSVCPSVRRPVCPSARLSVDLLSVGLSVRRSVCLPVLDTSKT